MIILGIETSCDETGIAIYDDTKNKLLANKVYSQQKHNLYGGIVPEIAARDHLAKIYSLIKHIVIKANITLQKIDAIAYTSMPGLIGALMVGAAFAKTLSYMLNIPSIAIHHLEGHILSTLLSQNNTPQYPYIALIISGGHTQLIKTANFGTYEIIGESVDDAIGETFDKIAKILNLPYPGGPYIDRIANSKNNQCKEFKLPMPMCNNKEYNFSFSGLKTAVINIWNKYSYDKDKQQEIKINLISSFQNTITKIICYKCLQAINTNNIKNIIVVGGVSANTHLRYALSTESKKHNFKVFYPDTKYCTDNAAMIAIAGSYRLKNGCLDKTHNINIQHRFSLNKLKDFYKN